MIRIVIVLCILFSNALFLQIIQKEPDSSYCYTTDNDSYKYFSSKTAYEFVYGDVDLNEELENCKPVQFWSINRHGTRFPSKKSIRKLQKLTEVQKQIINNYEKQIPNAKINGLCQEDVQLFKNWFWNSSITENSANLLTVEGWNELRNIAKRNAKMFPELLAVDYSEKDYLFRFGKSERTESSFKAYAQGLFGTYEHIYGISFKKDTLIETYKNCPEWIKRVSKNSQTYVERDKFFESNIYKYLILDISQRLGFSYNLDPKLIDNIYNMCRFQQAWYPKEKSVWCASFTKEHLQIIEYVKDLNYYYSSGYGTELNKKVGCMPLKDMINRFENIVNGNETEPKSVHYFTHSIAMRTLIASMEMKKDKIPLTADNWPEQQNRFWKTSIINPFATNINAVLLKCPENEYKVTFYLNEKKYDYPGCSRGICSWKFVKEKFANIVENCNLDFCESGSK